MGDQHCLLRKWPHYTISNRAICGSVIWIIKFGRDLRVIKWASKLSIT